jgi:hypothetical protein
LKITRNIFKLLQELDIRIAVTHIRGLNNGEADALSRMDANGDYELKDEVYHQYAAALNVSPTVDLFASAWNAKTARFVALAGPQAMGAIAEDALAQESWQGEVPYAFPPNALIPDVLHRIWTERILALVVVPHWPGQAWWSLFRELAEVYIDIGRTKDILIPGPNMTNSETRKDVPPGTLVMGRLRRK